MLGLTLDPDFANNRFVYLFYSPADTSVNRLSPFECDGDSLKRATDKVVLQFYSQREICCHTGGSLAFGPGRLLFVSTGDSATPFDEKSERYPSHGFSLTDDRPGHEPYDARRTSANTNDLRGKILRLHVKTDGTYDIPEGNLFAQGTPNTKPEIFVMGNRNPYRIAVDQKRGWLYWGEVGPDAGNDSLATRGPRGYDEIYQARAICPPYYEGKFFIYDWIRHWIMAVTLSPNGNDEAMERFAPRDSFSALIDMELGPNGQLYVLEYGKAWFAKNADAGLSTIEYRGKR
ncbi:MAG: PQQ-dependent sugar dehydrogenase [Gemmatimonas sp.]|nr:PQQ-dependent sugar dehydrogenase [Gemmatimonas sp.]